MDNSIVGVRYVGKKPSQEDTVCKTGCVWVPNQVHNFALALAKRLFVHTDSFEQADIDMDGETFMSAGKSKPRETASYVNLSAMSVDQLLHLARFEFNRVVNPEGKDIDQIRREVQGLMVNHSLDIAEDERKQAQQSEDYVVPLIYQATPEEMEAIKAGRAELRLVPIVDPNEPKTGDQIQSVVDLGQSTQSESTGGGLTSVEQKVNLDPNRENVANSCSQTVTGDASGEGGSPKAVPLADQVAAMTKAELIAFAAEKYEQKLNVRSSVDELRGQVLALINKEPAL